MPNKRKRDNEPSEDEQLHTNIEKKRKRVLADLQSNLTEKMTTVKSSPNGLPTSRFGRVISSPPEPRISFELRSSSFGRMIRSPQRRKSYLTSLNKRKVHKIHSLHHCELNPNLRLISREEINSKNSIVDKLITVTKQKLNDHQFQTLPLVQSDECNLNSTETAPNDNADFEVDLPINVVGPFRSTKSKDQLDESETKMVDMIIDLTDQSDIFDSVNSNEHLNCAPINSTEPLNSRSDSPAESVECISKATSSISKSISTPSMVLSDTISMDPEQYAPVEIDNENTNSEMNNNSNEFKIGDIVWAAATGFRFWPAIVWNSNDESYMEGNFFC